MAEKPSREEILTLAEKVGVNEAARQLGVPSGTIKRWRSEDRVKAGGSPTPRAPKLPPPSPPPRDPDAPPKPSPVPTRAERGLPNPPEWRSTWKRKTDPDPPPPDPTTVEEVQGLDRATLIRMGIDDGLRRLAVPGLVMGHDRKALAASVDILIKSERMLIDSEKEANGGGVIENSDPTTPEGRAAILRELRALPRELLMEALGIRAAG